jgi:hypothetical protein
MSVELSRDTIESAAWVADIDMEEGIYWNYRGRFGLRSDFNIVGSHSDVMRFLVQLAQDAEDPVAGEAAWEMAQNVATDNMAYDYIFSFPGVKVPDKPDGTGNVSE